MRTAGRGNSYAGWLVQGMEEVKEAAEAWEKQAQASLQQLDRLKDILEESAAWSGPEAVSGPEAKAKISGQEVAATEEGDGHEAGSECKDESKDLEKRYLQVMHCLSATEGGWCSDAAVAGYGILLCTTKISLLLGSTTIRHGNKGRHSALLILMSTCRNVRMWHSWRVSCRACARSSERPALCAALSST